MGSPPATVKDLRGILPVFQTPFNEDESIDWSTLERELHWLIDCGSQGVVMAMVSEVLRLSGEERREMAEFLCRTIGDRGAVVISVGAESSNTATMLARHAESSGATAVMAIPPLSIAVPPDELLRYFGRILEAVSIPVIIQDASGYVGRPMPIGIQAQILAEYGPDRALFKPEALPLGPNLSALRDATQGAARIFEGSGGISLVDSHRRGIVGTMPGADLIVAVVALWNALESRDEESVYRLSLPLAALISLQHGLDGFLAIEKHLLKRQGIFKNTVVRPPVAWRLDDETRHEADRLFDMLSDAVASVSPSHRQGTPQ
jgi:4-hydroxy-tetrahydrodipicolinate synthase